MAGAHGRDAIDATIAAAQPQFPGFVFTLAGPVDAHHRQARFTWGLGPDGAEPLIVGSDVAVTDDDGRLATVLGFLDKGALLSAKEPLGGGHTPASRRLPGVNRHTL